MPTLGIYKKTNEIINFISFSQKFNKKYNVQKGLNIAL